MELLASDPERSFSLSEIARLSAPAALEAEADDAAVA